MAEPTLSRCSRLELLELMYAQSQKIEALQQENEQLRAELEQRRLHITQAGSIAHAALQLNGVFDSAQAAADQYLENMEAISHHQETIRQEMIANAKAQAQLILEEAEQTCLRRETETEERIRFYWAQLEENLQRRLAEYPGLVNNGADGESPETFGPDD